MKSILTLFFALALGLECFSQQGQPILSYNENGYSINEVKSFALASTELSFNWRNELVRIVNAGLLASGESLVVDGSSISWILDQVSYEEVKLESFTNSRRFGSRINFYPDQNFQGTVGVFKYGKCRLILFKTICMNLLETNVQVVRQYTAMQQENIYTPNVPNNVPVNGNTVVNVNCGCPGGNEQQQSYGRGTVVQSGVQFIPQVEPYYQPAYYGGGAYYGGVNYSHTSYVQPSYYRQGSGVSYSGRGNYSSPSYSQQGGPVGSYGNGSSGRPNGVQGNGNSGGPAGAPGNGPMGVPGNGR